MLISLYLLYKSGEFYPVLLSLLILFLSSTNNQKFAYVIFVILEIIYFNQKNKSEELGVDFKPYEKEIRQLLLKKDPSVLYKVSSLFIFQFHISYFRLF